jgi:hypothetical protein
MKILGTYTLLKLFTDTGYFNEFVLIFTPPTEYGSQDGSILLEVNFTRISFCLSYFVCPVILLSSCRRPHVSMLQLLHLFNLQPHTRRPNPLWLISPAFTIFAHSIVFFPISRKDVRRNVSSLDSESSLLLSATFCTVRAFRGVWMLACRPSLMLKQVIARVKSWCNINIYFQMKDSETWHAVFSIMMILSYVRAHFRQSKFTKQRTRTNSW